MITIGQAHGICHIRRDDEIEITYCDRLTDVDTMSRPGAPMSAPIGCGPDVAIFDDQLVPDEHVTCAACWARYSDSH